MIGDRVPDKRLTQMINKRLARTGVSQCKISVSVRNGYVTLSGTIQFDYQRKAILRAAQGVEGVRQVVDQLSVVPRRTRWA